MSTKNPRGVPIEEIHQDCPGNPRWLTRRICIELVRAFDNPENVLRD